MMASKFIWAGGKWLASLSEILDHCTWLLEMPVRFVILRMSVLIFENDRTSVAIISVPPAG